MRNKFEDKTLKDSYFSKIYSEENAEEYAPFIQHAREAFYDTGFGR